MSLPSALQWGPQVLLLRQRVLLMGQTQACVRSSRTVLGCHAFPLTTFSQTHWTTKAAHILPLQTQQNAWQEAVTGLAGQNKLRKAKARSSPTGRPCPHEADLRKLPDAQHVHRAPQPLVPAGALEGILEEGRRAHLLPPVPGRIQLLHRRCVCGRLLLRQRGASPRGTRGRQREGPTRGWPQRSWVWQRRTSQEWASTKLAAIAWTVHMKSAH